MLLRALARWLRLRPPAFPVHVPLVVHRQRASTPDTWWTGTWANALQAAIRARAAYPDDGVIRHHHRWVATLHWLFF